MMYSQSTLYDQENREDPLYKILLGLTQPRGSSKILMQNYAILHKN